MRGVVALAAPVAFAALAGCVLPERDNVHDPHNKPVAEMTALVGSGGRFTVYGFDASASCEGDCSGYRFQWELDDPLLGGTQPATEYEDFDDCGLSVLPGICQEGRSPVLRTRLELTREMLGCEAAPSPCTGEITRTVRVRVIGPRGGSRELAAVVRQGNRAPVIDLGGDIYVPDDTPPVHVSLCRGVPSASGCSSHDPDPGDALTAEWKVSIEGSATIAAGPDYVDVVRNPTASAVLLELRLRDSEGWAESLHRLRIFYGGHGWVGTQTPSTTWHVFGGVINRSEFIPAAPLPPVPQQLFVGSIDLDQDAIWIGGRTGGIGENGQPFVVALDRRTDEEVARWMMDTGFAGPAVLSFYAPPTPDEPGCAIVSDGTGTRTLIRLLQSPALAGTDPCDPAFKPCVEWAPPPGESPIAVFPSPADPTDCRVVTSDRVVDISDEGVETQTLATLTLLNFIRASAEPDGTVWVFDRTSANTATMVRRVAPDGAVAGPLVLPGRIFGGAPHPRAGGIVAADATNLVHIRSDLTWSILETPLPMAIEGIVETDLSSKSVYLGHSGVGRLFGFAMLEDGTLVLENETPLETIHDGGIGAHTVDAMAVDARGSILVKTRSVDLEQVSIVPSHLKPREEVPELRGNPGVLRVSPLDGTLWVGGENVEHYTTDGRLVGSLPNGGGPIAVDRQGRLWKRDQSGNDLIAVDPLTLATSHVPVTGGPVTALEADGDVICAVVTSAQLFRVTWEAGGSYSAEPLTASGVTGYQVSRLAAVDSSTVPGACAAVWVSGGNKRLAMFAAGETSKSSVALPLTAGQSPTGLGIDPRTGLAVVVSVWDFDAYGNSGIWQFDSTTGAFLTQFVLTQPSESVPAIPFDIQLRTFGCAEIFGTCLEAVMPLRYSQVRYVKFEAGEAGVQTVTLPLGEATRFDFVP